MKLMRQIRHKGVARLSLWVGAPQRQVWWNAFGAFLHDEHLGTVPIKSDDDVRHVVDGTTR